MQVASGAKRVRKAVFPAAGLGTRFLPATKAQPKEMLPLVDKPIIQYAVEEALAAGIEDIIIVTGRGKNAIEDHFDVSFELEHRLAASGKQDLLEQVRAISGMASVVYVRQKEALGLGHAILMARDLVGDEPFAVLLGDDVIDAPRPCIGQLMEVHARLGGSVIAIQQLERSVISSYGVIAGEPCSGSADSIYQVRDLVEKPAPDQAPSDLAIIGRYVLDPEIFDILTATQAGTGGEIQLTDALRTYLGKRSIHGLKFEGTRYDTGDKLGFLKATVEFALRRPDLGPEFGQYLKSLRS
jgi:UTP--glucose-1-phosphate uridylyltransferase